MKTFMISFIEDNQLGVYEKTILVTGNSLKKVVDDFYETNPTLFAVEEVREQLDADTLIYFSNDYQDELRKIHLEFIRNKR